MRAVLARDVDSGVQLLSNHIATTTQALAATATDWAQPQAWT